MAAAFDLFENPFILLKIDPAASAKDVMDALDDAIIDEAASEDRLITARQTLLAPLPRLAAEVSCLLDTPPSEWRPILTALRSSQTVTALRQAFKAVAPLSRANLLAHAASHAPPDAEALSDWIKTQNEVAPGQLRDSINGYRETSGFSTVELTNVTRELGALRELQARALVNNIKDINSAIPILMSCATDVIRADKDKATDALAVVVKAYSERFAPELSALQDKVASALEAIRRDPDEKQTVKQLDTALSSWSDALRPLQLLEHHKGREDPTSTRVLQDIRGLAIDLSNESSNYRVAFQLVSIAADRATLLPRVSQNFAEDRAFLEKQIAASAYAPLAELVESLSKDSTTFASDLRSFSFGRASKGKVKELRDAFIVLLERPDADPADELPWLMLRSVIINLQNDDSDTESALALLNGVLLDTNFSKAPRPIAEKFKADKEDLSRIQMEAALMQQIKSSQLGAALLTLETLLGNPKSPADRDALKQLRRTLRFKWYGRIAKWAFWPALILILIIANVDPSPTYRPTSYTPVQSPPAQNTYRPTSSQTPPPSQAPTWQVPPLEKPQVPQPQYKAEDIPPVGTGRTFSQGNIRYCVYQSTRLEFIRNAILDEDDESRFNVAIRDYNSRCSDYRYRVSDKSTVDSELVTKDSQLRREAAEMLTDWRTASRRIRESVIQKPTTTVPVVPTLPPPKEITQITVPTENDSRITAQSPSLPSHAPNLLLLDEAIRVQERLIQLGYLLGTADGVWGTQSRTALRGFRMANGLPASDSWDALAAPRLFSPDAIKAPLSYGRGSPDAFENARFTPPERAATNPLNRDDAERINNRLQEIGYYQGNSPGLWGPASRVALREFKQKNGLRPDDIWDAEAEAKLFDKNSERAMTVPQKFERLFGGTWAPDADICSTAPAASDVQLMKIDRERASVGTAQCEFVNFSSESARWQVKARCQRNAERWSATISLTRTGNELTWSSERGSATYFRCVY